MMSTYYLISSITQLQNISQCFHNFWPDSAYLRCARIPTVSPVFTFAHSWKRVNSLAVNVLLLSQKGEQVGAEKKGVGGGVFVIGRRAFFKLKSEPQNRKVLNYLYLLAHIIDAKGSTVLARAPPFGALKKKNGSAIIKKYILIKTYFNYTG